MAGQSAQEKTEPATEHKLREARKKGDVAQSKDLTTAVVLAGSFGVVAAQFGEIGGRFVDYTRGVYGGVGGPLSGPVLVETLRDVFANAVLDTLPMMIAIVVLGLAVSFVQVGPLLSFESLAPKLEKLNPLEGLKKTFFSLPSYIEFLKSTLKVLVAGLLCWQVVQQNMGDLLSLWRMPLADGALLVGGVMVDMAIYIIVVFLAIAVGDVFFQRWHYANRQKMSKQEIKEEFKTQEGSPEHKSERKRMHQEVASQATVHLVRNSDALITNPTHYACALRYDPDEEDAPRLLAKGQGALARRMREAAEEAGVPILRDPTLARALHELEAETMIPPELYEAVAEVLRWAQATADAEGGKQPSWVGKETD
ncbi:MAG: EscU/YscU/HrcU family type III secretion system export apparatus switch protein [Planctomycetota bacterium]